MAGNLIWAELLTENGREKFTAEQMGYGYRTSILKRGELDAIVLSAELSLKNSTKEEVTVKIEQFSAHRKATQPPGASMGSMFKNPNGDYAGRLIEACGTERHPHWQCRDQPGAWKFLYQSCRYKGRRYSVL